VIDCELENAALEFGGNFQAERPDLQVFLYSNVCVCVCEKERVGEIFVSLSLCVRKWCACTCVCV